MLTLKRRGHILDSGATPDSSTINILSQRARWVVRVSDADTEWFESTSVLLMGLNRIDRCESESGVNRMTALLVKIHNCKRQLCSCSDRSLILRGLVHRATERTTFIMKEIIWHGVIKLKKNVSAE